MEMREFIQKYFVPALKENKDTGNVELNIYQSVWEHPVRVPDKNEDIFVHCGKGHVLKGTIGDISDIIENGCPFCKKRIDKRYIKYSTTYESLGFVIDRLPHTLGRYKNVRCLYIHDDGKCWSVINPWLINVNTIRKNKKHWQFILFNRNKRDITDEICNLADEMWMRAFGNILYDQNVIVLPTKRSVEDMNNIKLGPEDLILVRCNNCGKIHIISACRIATKETYCVDCGTKIFDVKHAWYGVDINEVNSGDMELMWIPRVDTVTTLSKMRKHVRMEGINIDGIEDCSS